MNKLATKLLGKYFIRKGSQREADRRKSTKSRLESQILEEKKLPLPPPMQTWLCFTATGKRATRPKEVLRATSEKDSMKLI